jgi:hypothetical protein
MGRKKNLYSVIEEAKEELGKLRKRRRKRGRG